MTALQLGPLRVIDVLRYCQHLEGTTGTHHSASSFHYGSASESTFQAPAARSRSTCATGFGQRGAQRSKADWVNPNALRAVQRAIRLATDGLT